MEAGELLNDILSEMMAADARTKRSLRVVEHQGGQINALENELSEKSNLVEELKEQHSELLQVRDYMQEVQELQRQLIKLQEIEFLSHFTSPEVDAVSTTNVTGKALTEISQDIEKLSHGVSPEINGQGMQENRDVLRLPPLHSMPIPQSYAKGQLMDAVKNKLNFLGLGGNFPNDISHESHGSVQLQGEHETTHVQAPGNNYMTNRVPTPTTQVILGPPKVDGNEEDNINILRDALSCHQQSITNLSDEVLVLRKERAELLSYMQDFVMSRRPMDPKPKVDDSHHPIIVSPEPTEENQRFCVPTNISSAQPESDTRFIKQSESRKAKRKNNNYYYPGEEGYTMHEEVYTSSSLEIRASRLFETACKFFTPEQAHFILTVPTPAEETDSEEDVDTD